MKITQYLLDGLWNSDFCTWRIYFSLLKITIVNSVRNIQNEEMDEIMYDINIIQYSFQNGLQTEHMNGDLLTFQEVYVCFDIRNSLNALSNYDKEWR
jgi:hypothetical protein